MDQTGQPDFYVNDNPLNGTKPLGNAWASDGSQRVPVIIGVDIGTGGGLTGADGATVVEGETRGFQTISDPLSRTNTAREIRVSLERLDMGANHLVVDGEVQLKKLFKTFARGGSKARSREGIIANKLRDGTRVQHRVSSSARSGGGPTIDITFPGGGTTKVHIR